MRDIYRNFSNVYFWQQAGRNSRKKLYTSFFLFCLFKYWHWLKTFVRPIRLTKYHIFTGYQLVFTFFKWAIPGLFLFIFGIFQKTLQILQQINVKKWSSIWCWDSNSRSSESEPPPMTTRPGLPPKVSTFYFSYNVGGRLQQIICFCLLLNPETRSVRNRATFCEFQWGDVSRNLSAQRQFISNFDANI